MSQPLGHNRFAREGSCGALLVAALVFCWLTALGTGSWALNGSPESPGTAAQIVGGGLPIDQFANPGSASGTTNSGPLTFSFQNTQGLKIQALTYLGTTGSTASSGELRTLSLPSAHPLTRSSSSEGAWERSADNQASYYQIGYDTGPFQLRAKLLDVSARFSPLGRAFRQTNPDDLKMLQEAAGTRNVDLNLGWKLGGAASLTSKYNALRLDKPGDEKRGLSTTDTSHEFALALGPRSRVMAGLTEHDEAWDPGSGKTNTQRRTNALEFKTALAGDGNDFRMAMTTTRIREGERERSEAQRELHLNLAPTGALKFAVDSVTKSIGQGREQKTSNVTAQMQLAPSTQLMAALKSSTADSGQQVRESNVKFDTVLGRGFASGRLVAERKTIRTADPNGSKQIGTWNLNGGIGAGAARTNLHVGMVEEKGLGPEGLIARAATFHADRQFGQRLKLAVDREQKMAGNSERTDRSAKSAYTLAAQVHPRTRIGAQLNTGRSTNGEQQSAREVTLEHQARAFRLRAQQQVWREVAAKRAATQVALDVPRGEIAEWARDITHGHQFGDAREYMLPKEPSWLDMPFAGFRLWSKQFQGGPDAGVRAVGWAHRTMISDRYHVEIACQGRPEAEEGDNKGRPMPVRRKMVEFGTLVGQGLVAHTRYTGDESTDGAGLRRHDIGVGLRGKLSDKEQLEADVSREVNDGTDSACGRTSVTLLYALKASDEHEVSVKTGYAWSTDGPGPQRPEYRMSLGYTKPI